MSTQVSVVVPTYRRNDLLQDCLLRLLDQSLVPEEYEIVVCDDGPNESTRALVESLRQSARPTIRYIAVTVTRGPAGARNAGWKSATSEVIAFTDDDCQPDRSWLAAGLAAIAEADAVTGRTVVPLPDRPTDFERDIAGLATAEFITANCFVRRSALQAIGGFDERFTAAWREDSDLHFSLLELGYRLVQATDAVVVHPVRRAPWGVSLKQQRKGVFDPLLMQKHPQLYRQRIPRFPWNYYVIVAALVVAVGGLIAGSTMAFTTAAGIWGLFTLEFALRRLRGASLRPSHVAEMLVTSALIPPLSLHWRVVGLLRYGRPASGHANPPLAAQSR